MNQRRHVLQAGASAGLYTLLASLGLFRADEALAQALSSGAWQTKNVADTLKSLGVSATADSREVIITSPDIAENGAVVPVGVRSSLPKTDFIALMVEKNPNTLAAAYEIAEGTDPDVNMRIKMGQSSDVIALVRADGKYYMARKEIKVTLGGCGG
jgi:sulfur-oxidizing protein SoxY